MAPPFLRVKRCIMCRFKIQMGTAFYWQESFWEAATECGSHCYFPYVHFVPDTLQLSARVQASLSTSMRTAATELCPSRKRACPCYHEFEY